MVFVILGIVVAWVVFSAFLVTVVCINSSRLSQVEEPLKVRSARARPRARRTSAQIKPSSIPVSAETS